MHAILSRLIGCYAYSAICIRITILNSRAPPLTIVGSAPGYGHAVSCVLYCSRNLCPRSCCIIYQTTFTMSDPPFKSVLIDVYSDDSCSQYK